jgi:hypothetical protein
LDATDVLKIPSSWKQWPGCTREEVEWKRKDVLLAMDKTKHFIT